MTLRVLALSTLVALLGCESGTTGPSREDGGGMTEIEDRLKEFIGASVTSAVTVLDAKFGSLISQTASEIFFLIFAKL